MSELNLQVMSRELCHRFFQHFENDPAIFMDMSRFAPYEYDPARVDAYFDAQQAPDRLVFMAMLEGAPIGEVKLKNLDYIKKECSLGIHMRDDSVKGKGYGTQAEQMAIHYAFHVLGMRAINADTVLKNTRSQHVLEKLGFEHTHSDDTFKFYRLEKHCAGSGKGNIIFLNGVSSAGKTTLAKALQSSLPAPHVLLNSDTFYHMMPEKQLDNPTYIVKAMTGMSHAIKAYSDAGVDVIVDHVLLKLYGMLEECVLLLHDHPVLFVHVTCPLEELRRREKERGDRLIGQAESQLSLLHPQDTYDLTVDTFACSAQECVSQIADRLRTIDSNGAFKQIWLQMKHLSKGESDERTGAV